MDNSICQLGNDYIFLNVINYYTAHLRQLIAASLLNRLVIFLNTLMDSYEYVEKLQVKSQKLELHHNGAIGMQKT